MDKELQIKEDAKVEKEYAEQARQIRCMIDSGRTFDFSAVKDINLIIAVTKEICQDLSVQNIDQQLKISAMLGELEFVEKVRGEAAPVIEKLVRELMFMLKRMNVENLHATQLPALPSTKEWETELFQAFTDKQRDLILKVVRTLQTIKPHVRSIGVMTRMGQGDIERLQNDTELKDARQLTDALRLKMSKLTLEQENAVREATECRVKLKIAESTLEIRDRQLEEITQQFYRSRTELFGVKSNFDSAESKSVYAAAGRSKLDKELETAKKQVKLLESDRTRTSDAMIRLLRQMSPDLKFE